MPEQKDSCVTPARGPIVPQTVPQGNLPTVLTEVKTMLARVGQGAPDFEANAFIASKGFIPVKLSNFKGKWIVLCFYPGDFTFV